MKLHKFFKNKKVLITGHTGFKGAWLSQILLQMGARVCGIALVPNTKPNLFSILKLENNISNYFVDIRNFKKVAEVFKKEKPEIVFHLAANTIVRDAYENPLSHISTNVLGTAHIMEAIMGCPSVKSAVVVTTDKVYKNDGTTAFTEDDPLLGHDPYSGSKAAADVITQSYMKSFFNVGVHAHRAYIGIARAGNVLGGGDWGKDRIVSDIVRAKYEHKEKLSIRNPDAIRPWQYIFDVLNGYLMLAQELYKKNPLAIGAWNFACPDGSAITVKNILEQSALILGGLEYKVIPDNSKHEARVLRLNSEKANRVLKWQSRVTIAQAVNATLGWYKDYYLQPKVIQDKSRRLIEDFFIHEV